jgi:hypothetical protein
MVSAFTKFQASKPKVPSGGNPEKSVSQAGRRGKGRACEWEISKYRAVGRVWNSSGEKARVSIDKATIKPES